MLEHCCAYGIQQLLCDEADSGVSYWVLGIFDVFRMDLAFEHTTTRALCEVILPRVKGKMVLEGKS